MYIVIAGVKSVAFKGPRRDQIEIIGDGVDAARLAKLLRKKLGYADLVSVEEIAEKIVKIPNSPNMGRRGCHHHEMELHIYDPPSSGGCTIM